MTLDERLKQLAADAEQDGDASLAVALYVITGAREGGNFPRLVEVLVAFARQALAVIAGSRN